MNSIRAALLGAAIGVLVNGAANAGSHHKPLREQLLPKYPMGLLSTGSDALDDCAAFTRQKHPTKLIKVELQGSFDPRKLDPKFTQMDVTHSPWTTGDPGTERPFDPHATWSPRTRLDMNLGLASAPTGPNPKPQMMLLNVVIDDQTVHLRDDAFAIAASDVNGRKMFCRLSTALPYGKHEATFVAFYYFKPNHPDGETYGSFNIGLIVPDTADPTHYMTPIFIDPEVENNGFY